MILLSMSVFGGLLNLKHQNNPACFKSVRLLSSEYCSWIYIFTHMEEKENAALFT